MKVLYLDCGMGAAGDMLQGALVSLLTKEDQESFTDEINNIGLEDVRVSIEDDMKCGVTCSHVRVHVGGHEEHSHDVHEHEHEHVSHGSENHEHEHHHNHEHNHDYEHSHEHSHDEYDHEHHHEHHHTSLNDIRHIVGHLNVSDKVKKDVIAIYEIVAKAESTVHGKDVSEVHFHEVGMKDAIADIAGVAILMEKIGADKVICSPINTGFGKVRCAHGILPVPAPATAEIIKGIPTYAGRFEGEMCTPTGAALLKYYSDDFANAPLMVQEATGYGSGNKDFEAANVIKAVIGSTLDNAYDVVNSESEISDSVTELRCNIDDMTGEEMAYAVDKLIESGVRDAFVTPIIMKKGRPGFVLTVLTDTDSKMETAQLIFKYTSTIGIREYAINRMILDRTERTISTEYGDIRIKVSQGYGVKKEKPEFEDLKTIAKKSEMSLSEVKSKYL